MPLTRVEEALARLGLPPDRPPPRPIVHAPAGALLTVGFPGEPGVDWTGIWIDPSGVSFLGPVPTPSSAGEIHGLPAPSDRLAVLLAEFAHRYVERVEQEDERLAELQQRGREVPLGEVWRLKREAAGDRAMVDRANVVLAECSGAFGARFPGFDKVVPTIQAELDRVRALVEGLQNALSDLILLRNAEESNRIAETANALSRMSNRIAALANISNIRMLGLTYLAFLIALIGAVVLIPNTGATILGMPSAGWVPGLWVDLVLIVLAVVPLAIVFRLRWVQQLLRDLRTYESRAVEGLQDLPERVSTVPARVRSEHASGERPSVSPGSPHR